MEAQNRGWRLQRVKLYYIARATPCEVRFGLCLAQIAPSFIQNKKRVLHANLRSDLDKLAKYLSSCNYIMVSIEALHYGIKNKLPSFQLTLLH